MIEAPSSDSESPEETEEKTRVQRKTQISEEKLAITITPNGTPKWPDGKPIPRPTVPGQYKTPDGKVITIQSLGNYEKAKQWYKHLRESEEKEKELTDLIETLQGSEKQQKRSEIERIRKSTSILHNRMISDLSTIISEDHPEIEKNEIQQVIQHNIITALRFQYESAKEIKQFEDYLKHAAPDVGQWKQELINELRLLEQRLQENPDDPRIRLEIRRITKKAIDHFILHGNIIQTEVIQTAPQKPNDKTVPEIVTPKIDETRKGRDEYGQEQSYAFRREIEHFTTKEGLHFSRFETKDKKGNIVEAMRVVPNIKWKRGVMGNQGIFIQEEVKMNPPQRKIYERTIDQFTDMILDEMRYRMRIQEILPKIKLKDRTPEELQELIEKAATRDPNKPSADYILSLPVEITEETDQMNAIRHGVEKQDFIFMVLAEHPEDDSLLRQEANDFLIIYFGDIQIQQRITVEQLQKFYGILADVPNEKIQDQMVEALLKEIITRRDQIRALLQMSDTEKDQAIYTLAFNAAEFRNRLYRHQDSAKEQKSLEMFQYLYREGISNIVDSLQGIKLQQIEPMGAKPEYDQKAQELFQAELQREAQATPEQDTDEDAPIKDKKRTIR